MKVQKETFAPTIIIKGETITPKGYVWILGFALAGCSWAIEAANKPEFLKSVRKDLEQEAHTRIEKVIQDHKQEIERLTARFKL